MLGIYVHIPFCERKCNYCAFSSFVLNSEKQDEYVSYLVKEIENAVASEPVDTVYFGGGTPSLLDIKNIEKIVSAIKSKFEIASQYEWTIECNPNSVTKEKIQRYKELGINRISLGVQSLDDKQLQFIGRVHSREQVFDAVKTIQSCGIKNISCDLIIGLNDATEENFLAQLEEMMTLDIQHISCYMLQIEDGTKLKSMVEKNADLLPSEDECSGIYEKCAQFLKKNGFFRYEVSNFAKKGFESKHNFKYWSNENYIGFGLAAHSYIDHIRYANSSKFEEYYDNKNIKKEVLTKDELIEEHIMLGLRCCNGVSKKYLLDLGYDITQNQNLESFKSNNIIFDRGDKLYLNEDYYNVNNFIIVKMFPEN